MNIDQFLSQIESSDVYRHNEAVRKLVSESRQTLIDLAHGDDRDAFKAELLKFNDRLDECLNPSVSESELKREKLFEVLKFDEQYLDRLGTLSDFGFIGDDGSPKEGDAPVPGMLEVFDSFTPEMLRLATTFQESTLLLVPETSFAAKVAAIDAHRTMVGQMETDMSSIFSETDSGSNRIVGWRTVIVNGKRDWDYDWGAEDKEVHFEEEMARRKALLLPGEKNIDRNSYAMLMMKGIQKGDPIDQNGFTIFPDDPAVSSENFPSGEWAQAEDFDPPGPRVGFFGQSHNFFWQGGRFRSSVGGDVVLNAVGEKKGVEVGAKPQLAPLSPEATEYFLKILKARFESHPDWHPGLEWPEVERALKAHPEKLVSLQKMEDTGGEPDLLVVKEGEIIFADCSDESPSGRMNVGYFDSIKQSKAMGVKNMPEDLYRLLQDRKPVDNRTRSYLLTPHADEYEDDYWNGGRQEGEVFIDKDGMYGSQHPNPNYGWRGVLRVPKV